MPHEILLEERAPLLEEVSTPQEERNVSAGTRPVTGPGLPRHTHTPGGAEETQTTQKEPCRTKAHSTARPGRPQAQAPT